MSSVRWHLCNGYLLGDSEATLQVGGIRNGRTNCLMEVDWEAPLKLFHVPRFDDLVTGAAFRVPLTLRAATLPVELDYILILGL